MAATNHTEHGLPLPVATDKVARQDILDISNNVEGQFMAASIYDKDGKVAEAGGIVQYAVPKAKVGKELFRGAWSTGSITVPGLSDYTILYCITNRGDGIAVNTDQKFRFSTNYPVKSGIHVTGLDASVSGDTLTLVMSKALAIAPATATSADLGVNVAIIFGIL